MAVLKILKYPDPILRQKAKKITVFDDKLKKLAANMGETMYDAPGVGLAANQIGVLQQIIVVDVSKEENEKKYIVLINPVISNGEGEVVDEEGCLSVLDYTSRVRRFRKIHVSAQDLDGKPLEFDAEDRFARIIQHEVDHLHGKLFIDRISALKRGLYKKKLKKILKQRGK
ncbi:peptide deformylase [Desulfolithobacter dissulfuricans]|uniref:Peptide deformylase n=1 Tax=Desulfolithobacter dissulfuricans TaxID=2795293 RepID=A0A915XLT8_9BACT|nr:peptide deformylase [Desulfolithobacter dissulfuricans]BCO10451.1 peptide deformylase [Desulfolithobacter dissulfuricans]